MNRHITRTLAAAASIAFITTGLASTAAAARTGPPAPAAAFSGRLYALTATPARNAAEVTAREGSSARAGVQPDWSGSFTVTGSIPVRDAKHGNQSQDDHASDPNSDCDASTFDAAELSAWAAVASLRARGLVAPADLLTYFLTAARAANATFEKNYPNGSAISDQAKKDPNFVALNAAVEKEVASELKNKTGEVHIKLKAPDPLMTITLDHTKDLEDSFRGTQGLEVSGGGSFHDSKYQGWLTYVIKDSYGYTVKNAQENLLFKALRYLQVNCGKPPILGGAHWFPDSVTVTVGISGTK